MHRYQFIFIFPIILILLLDVGAFNASKLHINGSCQKRRIFSSVEKFSERTKWRNSFLVSVSNPSLSSSSLALQSFDKCGGSSRQATNYHRKATTKVTTATELMMSSSNDNDQEEKRLQMLTSRRESIRSTLKIAQLFKEFRISNGTYFVL